MKVEVSVLAKSSRGNAGLLGAKRRLCVQACFKRPIVSGRMAKMPPVRLARRLMP